jgi:hypothetical protein
MEGRCSARHELRGGRRQCEERIWQGRRGCWWRVLEWVGILGTGRCGVSPLEGVAPHTVGAGGRLSPPNGLIEIAKYVFELHPRVPFLRYGLADVEEVELDYVGL